MTSNKDIIQAINNNDIVIISGSHQYRALNFLDTLIKGYGKTLSNGSVLYNFGVKKVFVGDMPEHPSLQHAYRMEM